MAERKVLNKYYPPDFDPAKLPKGTRPKNGQEKVRMMLPMNVRCITCGEFMVKGTKYNSRKETIVGEEYLGIKIYRFYQKCKRCATEFTIKTDPKESDYQCEMGVSRNFEAGWRQTEKKMDQEKEDREEEEEGDAMKALENRTIDAKREMDIIDGLDEIRALNAKNSQIKPEDLLDQRYEQEQAFLSEMERRDDELAKSIKFGREIDDEDIARQEFETEELVPENNVNTKKRKLPNNDTETSNKKQTIGIKAAIKVVNKNTEKPKKKKKSKRKTGLVGY